MREITGERQSLEQEVMDAHAGLLERKTTELLTSGSITIATTAGAVNGRIHRFRRGDFVIEVDHSRTDGRGHGSTCARLIRHVGDKQTSDVVYRLAHALGRIGPDADPIE
jgi:hypothetical protein